MSFIFASWNVEAFRAENPKRLEAMCAWLAYAHPEKRPIDVFAIMEVEGINLLAMAQEYFPEYDFHLTDGQQNKEIILGVRRGAFAQVSYTQRREFKAGNAYARPGSLVSVRPHNHDGFVHLLYLHAPAMSDPDGFGARMTTFEHVAKLKSAFDQGVQAIRKDANAEAQLIVLGDLNTAGLCYPTQREGDRKITSEEEIASLEPLTGLRLAPKSHDETWMGGRRRSDLDHVLTSATVRLRTLGEKAPEPHDKKSNKADEPTPPTLPTPYKIRVRGWPELSDKKRLAFAENISDHALLIGEVLTGNDDGAAPNAPKKRKKFLGIF